MATTTRHGDGHASLPAWRVTLSHRRTPPLLFYACDYSRLPSITSPALLDELGQGVRNSLSALHGYEHREATGTAPRASSVAAGAQLHDVFYAAALGDHRDGLAVDIWPRSGEIEIYSFSGACELTRAGYAAVVDVLWSLQELYTRIAERQDEENEAAASSTAPWHALSPIAPPDGGGTMSVSAVTEHGRGDS